jgi:GYF domain 2
MTVRWYYADNGRAVGPIALDDLKAALARIPNWKDTFVWSDGFSEWQPAGSVQELAASSAPAPPAPLAQRAIERDVESRPPARGDVSAPAPAASQRRLGKVLGAIAVIVAVILGGVFGKFISRVISPLISRSPVATSPATLEQRIASGLAQFRATLPKKVDDTTTAIWARNEGTKVILGYRIEADASTITDAAKEQVRAEVTRNVCSDKSSREILDLGGSFEFVYVDINMQPVTTIDIVKENCG